MSEEAAAEEEAKPKKGKGMLFGLIGALVLGGAGGFATYSGMLNVPIPGVSAKAPAKKAEHSGTADAKAAYVALDPIVVDLGRGGRSGQLRVTLAIETTEPQQPVVEDRKYRLIDTFNSFLRAVDERDLREPAQLERLRSRLLRRALLETPPGAVSDVLISEFVFL